MRVLESGERIDASVTTIGQFDGVHLGHRSLIDLVRACAAELDVPSAVVTFDRHPASVVRPDAVPLSLTGLDQKLELLESAGVDNVLVVTFDEQRAAESAEEFVADTLVDVLGARTVVVGHDFRFGRGRLGDADLLRSVGVGAGFEVIELSVVQRGALDVSSTAIRRCIEMGNLAEATALLGRFHEVRGVVVRGDQRGRELGYPTANVEVPSGFAIPADGVYAGTYVDEDGVERPTAISVGTRPMFYDDGARLVEAYLLDFDGDLYGRRASVRFQRRLRGQQRFDSLDALVQRIEQDVEQTRAVVDLP